MPPRKPYNCTGCGTVNPDDFAPSMKSRCKKCRRTFTRRGSKEVVPDVEDVARLHNDGRAQHSTVVMQRTVHSESGSESNTDDDRKRVNHDLIMASGLIDDLRAERDKSRLAIMHLVEEHSEMRRAINRLAEEREFYRGRWRHAQTQLMTLIPGDR